MEHLYDKIFGLWSKYTNVEGKHFVSGQLLRQLLTRDAIRDALLDQKYFAPYHVDQVIEAVLGGAHKTFAILVLIKQPRCIRKFIEHDQYHSSGLDHGLPFDKEKLSQMLSSRKSAVAFGETQWGFIAPTFCESVFTRTLPSTTVLPFLQEEKLGCGGFGEVYMIKIASSHQRLGNASLQNRGLVRKAFKPHENVQCAYENELHNLSILRMLRHPNIIEVLSCYAYRGEFNLIFPHAIAGTLETFLKSPRPTDFEHDHALLAALSGLCSAVSAVHLVFSTDHNLNLIGCHHDLKPANVLIDGPKFLLADFGLSRFKTSSESSGTSPRRIHPYYAAPECCQPVADSMKTLVHRSSDIWSLGCIVAEVVAYVKDGPKGVKDFERQRRFVQGSTARHRFHRGNAEDPAVKRWLEHLQESTSRTLRMLGSLVNKMLQLRPRDRPSAKDVETMMNLIGIQATCQSIDEAYSRLCRRSGFTNAVLERAHFRGWMYAIEIFEIPTNLELGRWCEDKNLQSTHKTLGKVFKAINFISLMSMEPAPHDLQQLGQLNDALSDELSPESRSRIALYVHIQIMSNPGDTVTVTRPQNSDSSISNSLSNSRTPRMLSALRSVTKASKCRWSYEDSIDPVRPVSEARAENFKVQLAANHVAGGKQEPIVETMTYNEPHGDPRSAHEIQQHLQVVSDILTRTKSVCGESFRALRCAGFYQNPAAFSCGLLYEYPDPSQHQDFITFASALKESQDHHDRQPSLEERFHLAHVLASSVLQFHKQSWSHKGISSSNIVVFHSTNESWLSGIKDPFFLGYSHSGQIDCPSIKESAVYSADVGRYQHPDYREKKLMFRPEYDYHSLGLVLLEIGLWVSLDTISDELGSDVKSGAFRDAVLQEWTPRLRISMGTRYQRVVETCLQGSFEMTARLEEGENSKLYLAFSRLVVEQLAAISL